MGTGGHSGYNRSPMNDSFSSPAGPRLQIQQLTKRYGQRAALDKLSFDLQPGCFAALLGPNGAGKSTLLKVLAGLEPPAEGMVRLGGVPLGDVPRARLGREIAYLAQAGRIHWPMAVETLVGLGRLPHANDPQADAAAVERALAAADILHLRERITSTLSGGERMRVLLARALAVEAPVLLADEPLAALDPLHQLATMERLKAEAARGVAVVVVLHDLGFAARYARRVVLMRGGRVVAAGLPDAVLTADLLRAVYDVAVTRGEVAGLPVFVPDLITPAP